MILENKVQLRHRFKVISGSTPESGKGFYWDGDIFWVTPEDLSSLKDGYYLYDTKRKITDEGYSNSGVTMAPINSIVLTKRAPIGLLAILGVEACSNQGCFLLIPNDKIEPRFYYYYLLANKEYLQILGRGSTFMELSLDDIKSFPIPDFSISAQKKIAAYLDEEIRNIDELIFKKQRQLELLDEQRQAFITHAVTKGINPNVQLKDSEIEWLGEIPIHWKVKKLKYLVKVNPSLKSFQFDNDSLSEVVFLPMEKVSEYGEVDFSIRKPIRDVSIGYTYFEKNDVVVAKITPCFENGKGALLNQIDTEFGFGTTEFHVLRCSEQIDPEYLYYVTISSIFRESGTAEMKGAAGQKRVTPEFIKEYLVPHPDIYEQKELIKSLNAELKVIGKMMMLTQNSIDLLHERRAALIGSSVLGHLDFI